MVVIMGCFDYFRFDCDIKFKNHKGDIIVIPGGNEYQTKDFENCMYRLQINVADEIEQPCFETIVNKEYPIGHPLRVTTKVVDYEKIDFSGLMEIYHYTNERDYVYHLWVEDGKIIKIEDKSE